MTRSPLSASVSSAASDAGARRSGACASITSWGSPATKRVAATFPLSSNAARSGRAGVHRGSNGGSAIACDQQRVERARGLAFCPFGPARARGLIPGINVEMKPGPGGRHESPHEHGGRYRARKAAARYIVDVGDFGFEQLVVRPPKRQAPKGIAFARAAMLQVGSEPVVIGIERDNFGAERDARGAGQSRHVGNEFRLFLVGKRDGIGQNQSTFGIGIADLDRYSLARAINIARTECRAGDRILDRRDEYAQPDLDFL